MVVFAIVVTLLAYIPLGAAMAVLSAFGILEESIRSLLTFGNRLQMGISLALWLLIGFAGSIVYAVWCRFRW